MKLLAESIKVISSTAGRSLKYTRGFIAVISEVREWAHEFEELYKNRDWDGEWIDTLTKFLNKKIKDIETRTKSKRNATAK